MCDKSARYSNAEMRFLLRFICCIYEAAYGLRCMVVYESKLTLQRLKAFATDKRRWTQIKANSKYCLIT